MNATQPGGQQQGTQTSLLLASAIDTLLDTLAKRIVRRLLELERAQSADSSAPEVSVWMSVDSAAQYLDWPRQRLYKLTASGAIPHYKQENRLLFRRDELDRWLAQYAQRGEWMPTRAQS